MQNQRFSLEEFKALFPDGFESQEQLLSEYRSFLSILEQVDRMRVPELSARQKAEIFRRAWERKAQERPWVWAWPALLRQPAVTFAAGLVLGCVLMFVALNDRADVGRPPAVDRPLTIERTRHTRTYGGRIVESLYPQIESPKIVVETMEESSPPQRVLHGTLDDGEIYIVWNL